MAHKTFQVHFLGVTFTLVGVLGLITWATLRPPQLADNQAPGDKSRAPASSINISESSADNKINGQTETLELKCITHGQLLEHQTQARQLRLVGRLCPAKSPKDGKFGVPDIINETNGFLATVFVPESNLFTSDYIYLAKGKNQVRLIWETEEGDKIHSEFVIVREQDPLTVTR
ncbi:MAG: hypothetical protein H6624_18690 [Bdellovibrionaceae bacterium]|nr:hypothetical protein [Bdellovibrionales bacterium]MCB9086374.1 hypothetical protein [Pseudobdellovibrionaceae bacterium]